MRHEISLASSFFLFSVLTSNHAHQPRDPYTNPTVLVNRHVTTHVIEILILEIPIEQYGGNY
jgi:hypothetical protein